jgi:hypothetical protein
VPTLPAKLRDLEALRALISHDEPLLVNYDRGIRAFVVEHVRSHEILIAGRYQLVHIYLRGYRRGFIDTSL